MECIKQYEEESLFNETLKIDEFYNNLLNETPAGLKNLTTTTNTSDLSNIKENENLNGIYIESTNQS